MRLGPLVVPDEPGRPAGPAWLAGPVWLAGGQPGWPGWRHGWPGVAARRKNSAPSLLSPQVGYVVYTYIQEEMQIWFASTRAPMCTTKTSGCVRRLCTKVGRGAQRQCAKVSWVPSHKTLCAKVESVPQRLRTKFESSPRNLRAHKGFVYIKYLWTQSLRALHQVYTQTTPMDTQK
jgi:hypothetical protein